ncbi:MAG: NAD(P)-dependent oxidoreductase [Micropruina sp.]|nr:phosphoglycerate dehydrogenase [Micropruina sp.]
MKLLLPADAPFELAAPPGVEVVTYQPWQPIPEQHLDAEAAVVWGSRSPNLAQLAAAPQLRWVQTLAAGPDGVLAAGFAERVLITSGRGFHDRPVTEHALALILAGLRLIPQCLDAQREHRWAGEFGGFRPLKSPDRLTSLIEAEVLIWGFGSIGQRLAPLLAQLGAHVRGVATTAGERGGFEVVDQAGLAEALGSTDVLVMVLPHSEGTWHALNADRLALLRRTSWVVNVGRGSTIDEVALVEALHAGRLGGAALDVTETEPLPADSPLWDAPNLILTPHLAGGRPLGAGRLIARNLAAFLAGEPLQNQVRG